MPHDYEFASMALIPWILPSFTLGLIGAALYLSAQFTSMPYRAPTVVGWIGILAGIFIFIPTIATAIVIVLIKAGL